MNEITLVRDNDTDDADAAKVRDTDLGERLGFAQPRMIRKLIKSHVNTLRQFGEIPVRSVVARTTIPGKNEVSRTVTEYWLNKDQALYVVLRSNTPLADLVTVQLIKSYNALKAQLAATKPAPQLEDKRVAMLEGHVIELLRRVADHPNGLLGSAAADLRARIAEVALRRQLLGDPSCNRTAVENEVREMVDYPRAKGAKWEHCPAERACRAHSWCAKQIDTLDQRIRRAGKSHQLPLGLS